MDSTTHSQTETPRPVRRSAWLGRYRRALAELEKYKAGRFYHGTPVTVDCPRYKGPGTAVTDNQCPPDQVAVLLENGNVWWYPMESCRPNDLQPPGR